MYEETTPKVKEKKQEVYNDLSLSPDMKTSGVLWKQTELLSLKSVYQVSKRRPSAVNGTVMQHSALLYLTSYEFDIICKSLYSDYILLVARRSAQRNPLREFVLR